jgi:hypothetical protein
MCGNHRGGLALTYRASPALPASVVRPGVSSPEVSGRLQRATTDAAGEVGTTAAGAVHVAAGAWSHTHRGCEWQV